MRDDDDAAGEELVLGRRRRARALPVTLGVLLVAAAVAAGVRHAGSGSPATEIPVIPAARSPVPRAPARSAPAPDATPGPVDADTELASVLALADAPAPLPGYVRQVAPADGCRTVAVGHFPAPRVAAAVHAAVPGARVSTTAVTLDQFGGLCVLRVRAARAAVTIVLQVVSPAAGTGRALPQHATGSGSAGRDRVEFAAVRTAAGWQVLAGARGPAGALPALPDLLALAGRPQLRW